ncbi:MAG: trypsin-like peptidase domain-containing protein [Clostridia bacterium]|nr:trypsin-like peptidase domain-containing protein [Clostridia bacterium]
MNEFDNEELNEQTEKIENPDSEITETQEMNEAPKAPEEAISDAAESAQSEFYEQIDTKPEAPVNPYASQAEEYRRQTAAQQQPSAPAQNTAPPAGNYGAQSGQYTQPGQGYPRQGYGAPGYGQPQNPYARPQNGNANPYSQGQYNPYQQRYNGQAQRPAAPNYQQPYRAAAPAPVQNTPAPAGEKKGAGKKIFAALIAIILIIALVGTGVLLKHNADLKKKLNGDSPSVSSQTPSENSGAAETDSGSDVKIAVSGVPSEKNALTTDAIAEKARASCTGVLVYTNADSSSAAGQGSGILVPIESSADDSKKYTYILTCAHVIDDKNVSVKVQLEDGTAYDAEIVGYDVKTDVGVLRIQATGLSVCEIGDSSALKVGSSVYAVGNPGGIEFFGSFTDGIVSAIDRPISSEIGYTMNCIQHTAAINPGNSGGALVNAYGQVVGINSQKIASASYEGMGFAIPINQAVKIADDLISYGYVKDRAKIGVTYYPLSSSTQYSMIARYNNLPSGALIIQTISPDSSLADTQVKQYDMIIAVNGEPLDKADVLLEKIDNGKAGDKLTLTIGRINNDYSVQKFDVEATLVEDKGSATPEETTTSPNLYPFGNDGFGFNFGN